MAQIRRRHVNVQVTSQDPTNKVFKGIYADSEHTMLLSSNKSYEFDINAGQSKELYIRYSQKPVTITFKGVTEGSYKVTGNFGEVNVSSEDVTANVEFLTDTSPYVDVTFSSIESTTEGYEIGDMRVGGALVHSLPYYLQNAVPGQKIEVSVEVGKTTTTTTSPGPTPILNILADEISASGVYPCVVEISGGSYGGGSSLTINNSSESIVLSINTSYMIRSIKAPNGDYISSIRGVDNSPTTLPYSFTTLEYPNTYAITIVDFIGATTTTSTPAPATLTLQSNTEGTTVNVKTENTDEDVSLSGTTPSTINIDMKDAPLVDV